MENIVAEALYWCITFVYKFIYINKYTFTSVSNKAHKLLYTVDISKSSAASAGHSDLNENQDHVFPSVALHHQHCYDDLQ